MIYIEFISRLPGATLEKFHSSLEKAQGGWDTSYKDDQLVLSLARTWRMGPEPEHLGVWYSPAFGFDRIDDWDRIFRSGEADALEQLFCGVARIDRAGCYDSLLEPVRARNGCYYAEFFRATGEMSAIRNLYKRRAKKHAQFTLNLLVHRVGQLAPEPGGLAVWTIPNFAALPKIARDLDGVQQPLRLETAGTYTDVGKQII